MRSVDIALQKTILQSASVPIAASVSLYQFLMGSNHLLSTALQNKTVIVQLPKIDIGFLRFPKPC